MRDRTWTTVSECEELGLCGGGIVGFLIVLGISVAVAWYGYANHRDVNGPKATIRF